MTRKLITELTEVASVVDADEIAVYSAEDKATRKASLATVKTFLTAGVGDTVDDAIAAITTPFTLTLLDDATAAAFLTTLGITSFAQTILDDASASAALTTLGVSAFAQTLLDDATASDALTTLGLSSFAKTLMDDADAATARATLGAVIGTDVQAFDAELAAVASVTSAADRLFYFTGSGTGALTNFFAFGRTLVGSADAAAGLTNLGVSAFAQTILDDADAAAVRATIGAAAAAGATITVKNDAGNISTVVTTLDFLTAHFTATESPSGEINLSIASNRVNAAAGTADRLALDNGTAWTTLAKGSNSTVLQVSSGGTLQYSTVTDAMLAGSISGGKIASLPNSSTNVSGNWTLTPVGTELIFGKEVRLASQSASPTSVGGLAYSTTLKAPEGKADSGVHGYATVLRVTTADGTAIANTTTPTNFSQGFTIPANTMTVGKTFRLRMKCLYGTTGSPTAQIRLMLGSTLIVDAGSGWALVTGASNRTLIYEAEVTCRSTGGSGTVVGSHEFKLTVSAIAHQASAGAVTIDTTASQTLQVEWTWSAASASNTIKQQQVTVEMLDSATH